MDVYGYPELRITAHKGLPGEASFVPNRSLCRIIAEGRPDMEIPSGVQHTIRLLMLVGF